MVDVDIDGSKETGALIEVTLNNCNLTQLTCGCRVSDRQLRVAIPGNAFACEILVHRFQQRFQQSGFCQTRSFTTQIRVDVPDIDGFFFVNCLKQSHPTYPGRISRW